MYHLRLSELHGTTPWNVIVPDNSYGGLPKPDSPFSGVRRAVQTVGVCRTPHASKAPRALVDGLCALCLANADWSG